MADARSKRRSIRQAASRKRSIYAEPDTDDDFEVGQDIDVQLEALPLRSASHSQKRRKPGRSRPLTRSKANSKTSSKSRSRGKKNIWKFAKPRKWRTLTQESNVLKYDGPSRGRIPPWSSLPLAILRDIFEYALVPHVESGWYAFSAANWLVKAATICRAFAQPALEALYQSPPLPTLAHPHLLLDLLERPIERPFLNYRIKVRSLLLDVQVLAYSAPSRGHFDLKRLVVQLPQLQHLEILSKRDEPPFRPFRLQRWTYPPLMFDAMIEHSIKLKTWRWSNEMIFLEDTIGRNEFVLQSHSSLPFQSLRHLVVCEFIAVDTRDIPAAPADAPPLRVTSLADAIAVLPNLKDLTFITCEVVVDDFLVQLPPGLQRLELTNCLELTSDMLVAYFEKHGSSLKELVLQHNPALNMAFLTRLAFGCPRLATLKMDLRYFSERINSNDADPLYDTLLDDSDIPTWPTTLQSIEFTHLQRMSQTAAENLFTSLLNSASTLYDLRSIVIHAHINIPWRDRAGFRDLWIGRLLRVFRRRSKGPSPHMGSLLQHEMWKQANLPKSQRKATHVMVPVHEPLAPALPDDHTSSTRRRSRRVAEHITSQTAASMHTTSASESASEMDADHDEEGENGNGDDNDVHNSHIDDEFTTYIQGQCRVVDVRVDNQRPRENQFTEGDFLDSEVSGDDDWREGGDDEVDGGYAW